MCVCVCLIQGYLCGPSCCFPGATIQVYLTDSARVLSTLQRQGLGTGRMLCG